ncbi:MAG: hypothetical protein H6R15_1578 [Proteobacteria bacterium]|nr:hypothetical protein [Pseudomonadota bacterium]
MMKLQFSRVYLVAAAIALGCSTASAAGHNAIFLQSGADGSSQLSNLSSAPGEELAIAEPEGANPAAATTADSTIAAPPGLPPMTAPSATRPGRALASRRVDPTSTPATSANEQYRDHLQQQMRGSLRNAANPAVSRRYLMQSRPPLAAFGR